MKKIGIVTIYDNNNYGNRLQNYALQQYLISMEMDVQTIKNIPYYDYRYGDNVAKRRLLKRLILNLPIIKNNTRKKEFLSWKEQLLKPTLYEKRYQAFEEFECQIKYYPELIGYYNMKKLDREFDFFIAGSDQIWNPRLLRGTGLDFLTFAKKDKRIAYAASISLDKVPIEYHKRFSAYLKGMNAISVREKQAVDILENDFGIECVQVIDPTMLITCTEWSSIAEKSVIKLPTRYVVCMFLGDKLSINEINKYALENECKVIWLNDKEHLETYEYGPIDFLKVISDAQMVFTDSFHGCVFSILFHTSFYAIQRKGEADYMFSRIRSLLNMFGLNNRNYSEMSNSELIEIGNSTWNSVDKKLADERNKAKVFLKKALKKN